jgi:hypothetical protein
MQSRVLGPPVRSLEPRVIDTSQPDTSKIWFLMDAGEPNNKGKEWGYFMVKGDASWRGSVARVEGVGADPAVYVLETRWGAGTGGKFVVNVPESRDNAVHFADRELRNRMYEKAAGLPVVYETDFSGMHRRVGDEIVPYESNLVEED